MKSAHLLLSVLAAVAFLHSCDATKEEPKFMVDKVISQVIAQVIHPITLQLNKYADSIRKLLEEHGANGARQVHQLLEQIAELIQPPLLQIFKILNNMGLVIRDLEAKVMSMLSILFENVKDISLENYHLLTGYIEQLVSLVSGKFRATEHQHAVAKLSGQKSLYFIKEIVGRIISRMISPVVKILNKHLDYVRQIIANKSQNALEVIKRESVIITEIIRPYIIRIINILNDMGVEIGNLKDTIKMVVTALIDNVKDITKANKQMFKKLMGHIVSLLLGKSNSVETLKSDTMTQAYIISSIIRPIISALVGPILDRIQSHITTITDAISNHASNIQAIITQQALEIAELLRPTMIRLINILNNVGVQISDLRSVIEQTIDLVMDSLGLVIDVNKQILKDLTAHVVQILIDLLEEDQAYLSDSYLVEIIIRPIISVVKAHLKSIFQSITTQGSQLTEAVKQHIENLANLLRPIISRLVPDLHGNPSSVRRILDIIFNIVGEISGVTSDSVKTILEYLTKVIIGEIVPTVKTLTA